jgi:serine/threonine-protein kinase
MVYVPGGVFWMGSDTSDELADADEFPQHSVTLDGFWIDQIEVTNRQFAMFLDDAGNRTQDGVNWLDLDDSASRIAYVGGKYQAIGGYGEHPVTLVSWYGASAYCEWAGGRLSTEAEWEYAARGTDGRVYPWGNQEIDCTRGNFRDEYIGCDDGYESTAPVGQFPLGASWCGALDMAGNVWEWCQDWRAKYSAEDQLNPTGLSKGDSKALRGSWCEPKKADGRAAHRNSSSPTTRSPHIGLRCVIPLDR